MNKSILIGRLTADPQLSKTGNGKVYTKFQLAVNRLGSDSADFISIVAWDKTAESIVKYMAKGRQIALIGKIQTGSYEKNGVKIPTFDVVVDQVEFIGGGNSSAESNERATSKAVNTRHPSIDELQETDADDMPF